MPKLEFGPKIGVVAWTKNQELSIIQNAAKLYLTQPSIISLIASSATLNNMKPYLDSLEA